MIILTNIFKHLSIALSGVQKRKTELTPDPETTDAGIIQTSQYLTELNNFSFGSLHI